MELKTSGFGSICVRPIEMLPVIRKRVVLPRAGKSKLQHKDSY